MDPEKNKNDQKIFIDKFVVPEPAKDDFIQRMNYNRNFIKDLPGFIEDKAYVRTNDDGDLICITVAVWENAEALENAKKTVQAEYQRQGFKPSEMMQRLGIAVERGTYNIITTN